MLSTTICWKTGSGIRCFWHIAIIDCNFLLYTASILFPNNKLTIISDIIVLILYSTLFIIIFLL